MAKRKELTVVDSIRDLKNREPFEPFRIVMASGDKYAIETGDNLVEMATQFFYASPGGDWFVFMRISQIVGIEQFERKRSTRRKAS